YKAHRPPAPDDLIPQFALVREATKALNIPGIELEMVEADDLIASYAAAALAEKLEVVIISSDKDLMQLIEPGVSMVDPMKQKNIGEKEVFEKFGVTPDKVIEVQALIGDSVDNVPGVPGIGPKTAAELIGQFGTLENLLANVEQIKQPKRREVLTQHAENARLSRRLVELKKDVPLPAPLSDFVIHPVDKDTLQEFLQAQNFNALIKRLNLVGSGQSSVSSLGRHPGEGRDPRATTTENFHMDPGQRLDDVVVAATYQTIRDEAALLRVIAEAKANGVLAVDTETTGLDATLAELVGISLSIGAGSAYYIPIAHLAEGESYKNTVPAAAGGQSSLFDAPAKPHGARLADGQLSRERVIALLQPLLSDPSVLKVGHNVKY
ncbi:MAG: hypothetical protein B7X02_02895, partial [Rhodospirillales bacterium 12-54-5]